MKTSLLEKIGMNKSEALVYQDLIEYGESSPPKIAERTKVSRENVYFILKNLKERSLIEQSEKKGRQIFTPLNPKALKNLIAEEKQKLAEKESLIENILPELTNIFSLNTSAPSVSFFKGITGIKEMYEDVYRGEKPDEILAFRSIYDDAFLGHYAHEDLKRLTREGIKTRTLSSKKGALPKGLDSSKLLMKEKLIDKFPFDLPAEIGVYNNKVLIASFKKDKIGTIIEGKEIADTMRIIFNYIWEKE